MSTTQEAYWNALLADATYALGDNVDNVSGIDLVNLLKARMTEPVATYIAANFSLVTHIETDDTTGSGFDATVWRRSDGKLYVSMQGTEGLQDFLTDAKLALAGNAGRQVIDMVNWWFKITTPVGQSARQLGHTVDPLTGFINPASDVPGAGLVSAADLASGIEVNGHSLGGYLASAFTRLLGAQAHVIQTTTFNSAGFALGSESAFVELARAIGPGYGFGAFPVAGSPSQLNYFAEHGLNVTTNTLWFNQVGQRVELFNEESGSQVPNHFMYKLTDALALANAMSQLDSTMSLARANEVFEAGSAALDGSLEGVLHGLRQLLIDSRSVALPTGDVSDSAGSRVTYHETLKQLVEVAASKGLIGKVRIDLSGIDLRTKARNDFSAFASLITLSPVVLTGLDATLDSVLRTAWGSTYTDWQTDKGMSQADRAAGKETYTDNWINDRSRLLNSVVLQNQRNSTTGLVLDPSVPADRSYEFHYYGGVPRPGETLAPHQTLIAESRPGTTKPSQLITFGDNGNNRVDGTDYQLGDHLYGGAGDDVINGLKGNDYLEGNADNDLLNGGDGSDVLLGGAGTDTLEGGLGNDQLKGGADNDTYVFTAGWGADTIFDSDGGVLQVDGFDAGLPQGKKIGTGRYQSVDGRVTYVLSVISPTRTDLTLSFAGRPDRITIQNWVSGQFGISFNESVAPTSQTLSGDKPTKTTHDRLEGGADGDELLGLSGNDALSGLAGNDVINGDVGDDLLAGGYGSDVLDGGDGNDWIFGSSDASGAAWSATYPDWQIATPGGWSIPGVSEPNIGDPGNVIDGGAGNDWIAAGTGEDVVRGGIGQDSLYGMAGSDFLDGGDDADWIAGDDAVVGSGSLYLYSPAETHGNDTLVGGAGNDTLLGAGGADEIFGGADADSVRGDGATGAVPVSIHGNDYVDGGDGNDTLSGDGGNDELFGGTGNDALSGDNMDIAGGSHGADYLDGEDGDDLLFGDGGADTIFGGMGVDTLIGDSASDVPQKQLAGQFHGNDYLDGEEGNDQITGAGGADVLYGGDGDDHLLGDDNVSRLAGTSHGDDYLDGESGNDALEGDGGADTIYGGLGMDSLWGDSDVSPEDAAVYGRDILDGEEGNDYLEGGGAADSLEGGVGADTLFGDSNTAPLAAGVSIDGNDDLSGSGGDDQLVGGGGNDMLDGGADNDVLYGDDIVGVVPTQFHDRDTLYGGTGNDHLFGQGGDDALSGGDGNDWLAGEDERATRGPASALSGNDALDGGLGDDTLVGGNGADRLQGDSGNDNLWGGAGNDNLAGGEGNDWLTGDDSSTPAELSALVGNDSLAGGAGADTLLGGNGSDLLDAGDDADLLFGGAGNDTLSGGAGNDWLAGEDESVSDAVSGINGNDVLNGDAGEDTLVGGNGNDLLDGGTGSDLLFGGSGADTLDGAEGQDRLYGGAGKDSLFGRGGGTILDGGVGNDVLWASGTGNVIVFGRGSGHDVVDSQRAGYWGDGNLDWVQLGAGITAADVTVTRAGAKSGYDSLFISINGTSDLLELKGYFQYLCALGDSSLDFIRFADGTTWGAPQISTSAVDLNSFEQGKSGTDVGETLLGGIGADALQGLGGNDTIDGGGWSDQIDGGAGNDTILFGRGSGFDVVQNVVVGLGGRISERVGDVIQLKAGVAATDLVLKVIETNSGLHDSALEVSIAGTQDRLLIENYFNRNYFGSDPASAFQGESIRFNDGTVWDGAAVRSRLASATEESDVLVGTAAADVLSGLAGEDLVYGDVGNDSVNGNDGNDWLYGEAGNDVVVGGNGADILYGGDGNDTLEGGAGSDQLDGGVGSDTFKFGRGSGFDGIEPGTFAAGKRDVIQLGAGIAPGDVELLLGNSASLDMVVKIKGTDDELHATVNGYWADPQMRQIEAIQFQDGTAWDIAAIKLRLLSGNADANTIRGFATADLLSGFDGDDSLEGGDGNDTLNGDAGRDTLVGGFGDNLLLGGAQDDLLVGGGHDTMDGGAGNDMLTLSMDGATYRFGRGDGRDYIYSGYVRSDAVNSLELKAGIAASDIELRRVYDIVDPRSSAYPDSLASMALEVSIRGGTDKVIVSGFFSEAAGSASWSVGQIRFADGTIWSRAEMLRRAFAGTDQADLMLGTSQSETITGGLGNDTLDGGAGNDTLDGGIGNDVYWFGRGSGSDTVAESPDAGAGKANVLRLAAGLTAADVVALRNANDLVLSINGGPDKVKVRGFFAGNDPAGAMNPVQRIEFADGTTWDIAAIAQHASASPLNHAPTSHAALPNQQFIEGQDVEFTVSASAFGDVDPGDSLAYTATLADGSALPAWLRFDALTATFQGVAAPLGQSALAFKVTAEDRGALSASASFSLGVLVENKTLVGSTGSDSLVGLSGNDTLTGLGSNDDLFGGAGNDSLDGGTGADAMTGGSGNDIYVIDSLGDAVREDLGGGLDTVLSSISATLGENVENLTLSGASNLSGTGNALVNVLTGNIGSNRLNGGLGADTLAGGAGNDTYVVDSLLDVVLEAAGGGVDGVESSVDWTLAAEVENLTLTGLGAISGVGNSAANTLRGNAAANSLNGGQGADIMIGGAGDDVYVVDSTADAVTELANEGVDLVRSTVSLSALSANVENLTLSGGLAINGVGNASNNVLTGNSAANFLDGAAGVDTLVGGAGNDTYVVDTPSDVVTELANEGTDLVQSTVTYTLSANVENLTLTGSSLISGTGNTLDNTLIGNGANNTLTGGAGNDVLDGGLGNDTMLGGAGNDTYVVNVATDVVTELANEGVDTVQSAVTLTLTSLTLENLTLTGSGVVNGIGNANDNVLFGNGANNTLTGAAGNDTIDGGLGNDTMVGGAGNDVYVVNVGTDVTTENTNEGTDTVQSAVAWTLGTNLENLTLTGSSAINGTGNVSANVLVGNAAANLLSGLAGNDTLDGGAGNDTLNGAAGADTYLFARGHGVDTILDNDSTAAVKDRVQFATGITQADLSYKKVGNNLEATIIGSSDKIVVQDWYLGTQYHVEEFRFNDGSMITDTQVQSLVSAMALFSAAGADAAVSDVGHRIAQPVHWAVGAAM